MSLFQNKQNMCLPGRQPQTQAKPQASSHPKVRLRANSSGSTMLCLIVWVTQSCLNQLFTALKCRLCVIQKHMLPQALESLLFLRLIQRKHLSTVPAFFGSCLEVVLTSTVELKSDSIAHQFSA